MITEHNFKSHTLLNTVERALARHDAISGSTKTPPDSAA